MPAASAVRTASVVGAETATIKDAPIVAVFCTNAIVTTMVEEGGSSAVLNRSLGKSMWSKPGTNHSQAAG